MGPFLVHFPSFGAKIFFSENPSLSRTTSYGFLALCQNLEKANDKIPRKRQGNEKTDRTERMKGQKNPI